MLYTFNARLLPLNHWWLDLASINKQVGSKSAELDALEFMIEFQKELAIATDKLPIYLEEISNTLYCSAYKHTKLGICTRDYRKDA